MSGIRNSRNWGEFFLMHAFLLNAAYPATNDPDSYPVEEYLIQVWETEQGLPENTPTSMVQTEDTFLWFGTFNGLVRFDGIQFEVFDRSNTPQLPNTFITGVP